MAHDAAGRPGSEPGPTWRPGLFDLLADLGDLRLALSVDLVLTASAVEVGAWDVARDVVEGGRDDLAAFADLAGQRRRP